MRDVETKWSVISRSLIANPDGKDVRNMTRWFEREQLRRQSKPKVTHLSKSERRHPPKSKELTHKTLINEPDRSDREAYVDFVISWLIKYYGAFFYWYPVPKYIREIIELTLFESQIVLLEPRKHGKTITKIGIYLFKTIHWKHTMLVITSTRDAQKRIYNAYLAIIRSDNVIADYGKLMSNNPNRMDFDVWFYNQETLGKIDPFFRVASLRGGYVGSHSDHTDLEDIIQNMPVSDDAITNLMDNFDANILDLSDQITSSGTRKDLEDVYFLMIERGFKHIIRKAVEFKSDRTFPTAADWIFDIDEDGEPDRLRPLALTEEYLNDIEYTTLKCPDFPFLKLMKRYWQDDISFFSQMQNQPVPRKGDFFEKDWFREIDPFEDGRANGLWQSVTDPAFGNTYHSSDTATFIICMIGNIFYVGDVVIGKYPKGRLEDMIEGLQEEWHTVHDHIENDYAQIDTRYDQTDRLFKTMKMQTFRNGGHGKKLQRIETLIPKARKYQLRFFKTAKNLTTLRNQWLRYNGKKGRWDGLDALASACRIVQYGSGKSKYSKAPLKRI